MSQQTTTTGLRAVQAATIIASMAAGAGNMGLSLFVIPRILDSPTPLMLRQWTNMFNRTSRVFPPPMILSGLAYWYIAYATRNLVPPRARLYALAGLLCSAVSPWTWTFLLPINWTLLDKAERLRELTTGDDAEPAFTAQEEAGTRKLVDDWGTYNLARGVSVFLAGVIGLCATIF